MQYDVVYLSYDEPQKNKHFARVQSIFPNAHWVDGITGFDAAHKECAKQGTHDHVLIIDGDNYVSTLAKERVDTTLASGPVPDGVLSWSSQNNVNGLIYGNGGLKLWAKQQLRNMKSHEAADNPKSSTDFCWDISYTQIDEVLSYSVINGSDYQAFRAGYREGIKMALDAGEMVVPWTKDRMYIDNYKRLLIWMMIGKDVANGVFATLGARVGFVHCTSGEFNLTRLSSHDWVEKEWLDTWSTKNLAIAFDNLFPILWSRSIEIDAQPLTGIQSKFYKAAMSHPSRQPHVDLLRYMK